MSEAWSEVLRFTVLTPSSSVQGFVDAVLSFQISKVVYDRTRPVGN